MSPPAISVNDRIVLRDRPWIVRHIEEVEGGCRLLKLEALDGETSRYGMRKAGC